MKGLKYTGVMPALLTPLNSDRTIKEDAARKLINKLIADGADGFYIGGATGESVVLQPAAREALCEIVVDEVKGRVPVIVHVGAVSEVTAAELARHAQKTGATSIASVPPFYFKYQDGEVYNYYKNLAKSVDLPVMIYHLASGGANMSSTLAAKLFREVDSIHAIKWSVGNYFDLMNLKDITNGEMNILNGPDETIICGLVSGADGAIGSTYNCCMALARSIYTSFVKGDVAKARELQLQMNRVVLAYLTVATPKACLKEMVRYQGIDIGVMTSPSRDITAEESVKLRAALEKTVFEFAK